MLSFKYLNPKLLALLNLQPSLLHLLNQRFLCSVQILEDKQPTIQPITEHTGGVHDDTQYAPPGPGVPHYDVSVQCRCVYAQHLFEVLKTLTKFSFFICVFIFRLWLEQLRAQ